MRLLILEDDPVTSSAYANQFSDRDDYEVVVCESGEQALRLHQERPFQFVIVDFDLAGQLNGCETIEQMNASMPVHFLICTGNTSTDLFEQCARLLPVSYFTKPVDPKTIYYQVELHRLHSTDPQLRLKDRNLHTFEQIFQTANIGICLTDIEGRFVMANPAYCRTYGYSEEELIGHDFTMVLPDELKEPLRKMHYEYLMGTTEESGGRWTVRCKDGSLKPIFVTAARVVLPNGERYKATTVTDISRTVAFEEQLKNLIAEKELLLTELQHRVKNNFQSLASLIRLQAQTLQDASSSDDVRQFAKQIEARLGAMARTHELLSRYSMGGRLNACQLIEETIQQVLTSLLPNAEQAIELNIQCDQVELTDSQGVSLCLILNEALTNSIKYALPHRSPLTITTTLQREPANSLLELKYHDDGPGYDVDKIKSSSAGSLGMGIMTNLALKLNGSIEFWGGPAGAGFRLFFPLVKNATKVTELSMP